MMHGYSRKQLSDMLDITEQAVWQYENNYTSPKMQEDIVDTCVDYTNTYCLDDILLSIILSTKRPSYTLCNTDSLEHIE